MNTFSRCFILILLLASAGCHDQPGPDTTTVPEQNSRLLLIAGNYPLYYFASRIAGDSADVILPEISGDPANWKPDSEAIAQLQDADMVILNGAGYETWLEWVTLPRQRLLDTSAGFADQLLPLQEETVHRHGPEGEHSHQGTAFTVWLDPILALRQAEAIEQAISERLPGRTEQHRENLAELTLRLQQLDRTFRQGFDTFGDRPVVFSHPVYQYLEARYGLNGESVHWEPGQEPGTQAVLELRDTLQRHPARLMIWEDQPLEATVETLRQFRVEAVVFHPAANRPDSGDYFDVMEANLDRLLLQCCGTTIGPN